MELGTQSNPMMNQAEIFIKTPQNWDPSGDNSAWVGYRDGLGSRFFVGQAGSSVIMHGR